MFRFYRVATTALPGLVVSGLILLHYSHYGELAADRGTDQDPTTLAAPAGKLPATEHVTVAGLDATVLPSGRLVTPAGNEISVQAPKPFGLALSPDGDTLATVNSGVAPFSVTLFHNLRTGKPVVQLVKLNATFMGIAFSADGSRFYASGGDDGVIWVGDVASGSILASVNLNGPSHPLSGPWDVTTDPKGLFVGSFPGALALGRDGRYLYAVDQASFAVDVIDTSKIATGIDGSHQLTEPNNFAAVVGKAPVGRYPFGMDVSRDGKSLYVANVGMFQYSHLTPEHPTGNLDIDYPLAYPGAGYPEETRESKLVQIEKVDPSNLPLAFNIAGGIRAGYIPKSTSILLPGLGDPNVPESSSVYGLTIGVGLPAVGPKLKMGPLVGQIDQGIAAYSGSHPNAVVAGVGAIYVSNGNDDSVSIVDPKDFREVGKVHLSLLKGALTVLRGTQPVALALSPDGSHLYVAEAGLNALAVVKLSGLSATVEGHIPTGWWPSSVQVSRDGKTLYVANANGRGATKNTSGHGKGDPKYTSMATVNIIPVPTSDELATYTARVIQNNGFAPTQSPWKEIPVQIKHVIFLNKENATFDLLLGDLTKSRSGMAIEGDASYSLGYGASPNHHELALQFTVGDNFFLEPSVSSDGHRWLTDTYTTEFEQTNWPANYGGKRSDAGDDPEVFQGFPGRLGFTGDDSPEPNDYDQHGGVYLHLSRHNRAFVNFGNGFELSGVNEDYGTEPTGIRNHVNVPMEKVLRDNSDQLYAEFNTHIPDAPLTEDPKRYNRYSRFEKIFHAMYADEKTGACKLPSYVDLYYPNDHGGGANDINPKGAPWSFRRFVQDNDDALGLTVQLISHSPCWKDTVIFVIEDDVQNGSDHVNGSRSLFLAIGPYVKRQYVAKQHYSLSSVFKTVYRLLGVPPLNQYDAAAADMRDIFTDKPDFRPYDRVPISFAKGANATWLALSKEIDFRDADRDEVKLRRAISLSEGIR